MDIEAFYRNLGVTNPDSLKALTDHSELISLKKGDVLFREGDPTSYLCFHLTPDGVTYAYRHDPNGKEIVLGFGYGFGHTCIGANGIEEAVLNTVVCLTPMDFLRLDIKTLVDLVHEDNYVSDLYQHGLALDHDWDVRTHTAFLTYEGKERYLWFLEEYAPVADKIPQGIVASFLGMKPQSLSRIKKELRKEGKLPVEPKKSVNRGRNTV